MKVYRRRSQLGQKFYLEFKVGLDPSELAIVNSRGLLDLKIQKHGGAVFGKTLPNMGVASSLQSQINRIRNRWSIALTRTSGSVLLDLVLFNLRAIAALFVALARLIFGSRTKFSNLLKGVRFEASRVEDLKEIEVFVLISIAAIHQAIEYSSMIDRDDIFCGHEYRKEIEGLTFSGGVLFAVPGEDDVDAAIDELINSVEDTTEPSDSAAAADTI